MQEAPGVPAISFSAQQVGQDTGQAQPASSGAL